MKYLMLLLASLASVSSLSRAQVQSPVNDSITVEIKRIAGEWLAAYNGPDADALSPFYASEAQYISGHVQGLVLSGRDAIIANFRRGMSRVGHLERLDVLSIEQDCTLAAVLCRYDANNAGQKASGRNLLVLKKLDGKWLIVLHMTVV